MNTLAAQTEERFDTVLCTYVLNVLPHGQRTAAMADISALLVPGGHAYLSVLRGLPRAGRRGAGGCWQYPVVLGHPGHNEPGWRTYVLPAGVVPVVSKLWGDDLGAHATRDGMESQRTAIARRKVSAPARWLADRGLLVGRVLDYGCGRGADAADLGLWAWDPHHRPELTAPGA